MSFQSNLGFRSKKMAFSSNKMIKRCHFLSKIIVFNPVWLDTRRDLQYIYLDNHFKIQISNPVHVDKRNIEKRYYHLPLLTFIHRVEQVKTSPLNFVTSLKNVPLLLKEFCTVWKYFANLFRVCPLADQITLNIFTDICDVAIPVGWIFKFMNYSVTHFHK